MVALRPFATVPYLPLLSLRPAEMRALQELPNKTKDRMLPVVGLRPWLAANLLEKGLERLAEAYGDRPTIVSIDAADLTDKPRPVHAELAALRHSGEGYRNWCSFIATRPHFIPAVQISDAAQIGAQVSCFHELGRGLAIVVGVGALPGLQPLAVTVGQMSDGGIDTCFVLDLGKGSRDPLQLAVLVVGYCNTIRQHCPLAAIAIAASSFPADFTSISYQEIYERTLYRAVREQIAGGTLIYSDRGSARYERQSGGGGLPKPRIDYPLDGSWLFYRTETEGFAGYRDRAQRLIAATDPNNNRYFDANLRVWGTLMIERTAGNDTSAIKTPARSTAVRINLHLQRQTFFGDPAGLYDTEDDWGG
jgi:hypothetical protein